MMKKQYNAIDVVKLIMAYLVVAIHCEFNKMPVMREACSCAVPMFFAMSGYFAYNKLFTNVNGGG